ncbi:hypothetical protein Tsubulata_034227 [Turnera subulata]|uniref:Uncharacterized protein n=1 Tax=Turnera subulata TaxID=218843 RepID=A0A9Q0F0E4_9ROSI|nr:hypothetical protein Tsubulata_034227 [Turnera subulata]
MSVGFGKCSKIRHIVRLRQMLRRWRNKARMSSLSAAASRAPSDVPAGHVAVCVGSSCTRFVVRATYLNHPIFKKLLVQAEEEYGFANQGPLAIPCEESVFEEVIRYISRSDQSGKDSTRFVNFEDFQRYCHVGLRSGDELLSEWAEWVWGSMKCSGEYNGDGKRGWVNLSIESSRVRIGVEAKATNMIETVEKKITEAKRRKKEKGEVKI